MNYIIDYSIFDDTLNINSFSVELSHRRKGLGSRVINDIIDFAKLQKCKFVQTQSDLSKIALNFWLKNGFIASDAESKNDIDKILNSDANVDYIFEIDNNSIVELKKEII